MLNGACGVQISFPDFLFWAYDNIVISMFSYFSLGHWVCSLTVWNILRKWFFQQWNFVGTYCRSLGFSKSCLYYKTCNGAFLTITEFLPFQAILWSIVVLFHFPPPLSGLVSIIKHCRSFSLSCLSFPPS